jgi:hypothetical protein
MLLARIGPPRFEATIRRPNAPKLGQRPLQVRMHGDASPRAAFGDRVANVDRITDLAIVGHHHRPLQARDLAGSKAGLDRQQHDDGVAPRLPRLAGASEHAPQCGGRYDLGLST